MQIATVGPNLRLVVFQFLLSRNNVPATVPLKRPSETPPLSPISGVVVLPSTPKLNLVGLLEQDQYELVDAWFEYTERPDDKRKVRFVLCHKDYVRHGELHPEFVAKRQKLMDSLTGLLVANLWAVQGYLNPYLHTDGRPTGHKVLMLNCAGRVPTVNSDGTSVKVWSGGRDEMKQGVGELIPLRDNSQKISIDEADIVLENPSLATLAARI